MLNEIKKKEEFIKEVEEKYARLKESFQDLKVHLNSQTVAALGFGDIPAQAFMEAFNMIRQHGWVSFNIKETFLDKSDKTGFSRLVRELILSEFLDLYYLERYRHRFSVEGEPLYYFALAGRKNADVPIEFLKSIELI